MPEDYNMGYEDTMGQGTEQELGLDYEEDKELNDREDKGQLSLQAHKQHQKIENPWIDKAIHDEYLDRTKVIVSL